eukprot:346304_1
MVLAFDVHIQDKTSIDLFNGIDGQNGALSNSFNGIYSQDIALSHSFYASAHLSDGINGQNISSTYLFNGIGDQTAAFSNSFNDIYNQNVALSHSFYGIYDGNIALSYTFNGTSAIFNGLCGAKYSPPPHIFANNLYLGSVFIVFFDFCVFRFFVILVIFLLHFH